MMDFIMVPLIVGTVTLGIYKLFELFVRKKERLIIIDKLGEKLDPTMINGSFREPVKLIGNISTGALKAGCLLAGIGLGLIVGLFIARLTFNEGMPNFNDYYTRELMGVIFGSSVLLFGGLSLLIAFVVEMKVIKNKEGAQK